MYQKTNAYLKECRLNKKLSQVEIGKVMNYRSAFIANWERNVSFVPLDRLSEYIKLIGADKKKVIELYLEDTRKKLKEIL